MKPEGSDPIIFYASQDDSACDILERLGIARIKEQGQRTTWYYKGKTVFEPEYATYFEDKLLEHFNIQVVYRDKNQLTMFP